jgi:MYXO-CTERM domain-containing protein
LPAPPPVLSHVTPDEVEQGSEAVVVVHGTGLLEGATASFGDGISVTSADVADGTELSLTLRVASDAEPGARTLTVTNPGGGSSSLPDALRVLESDDPDPVDPDPGDGDGEGGCSCQSAGGRPSAHGALVMTALLVLGLFQRRRREWLNGSKARTGMGPLPHWTRAGRRDRCPPCRGGRGSRNGQGQAAQSSQG